LRQLADVVGLAADLPVYGVGDCVALVADVNESFRIVGDTVSSASKTICHPLRHHAITAACDSPFVSNSASRSRQVF